MMDDDFEFYASVFAWIIVIIILIYGKISW